MPGTDAEPSKPRPRVLVGGLHLGGAGYPNARQTLRVLRERLGANVIECGAWLPADLHLWRLMRAGPVQRLRTLTRLAVGNLASLLRVMRRQGPERIPVFVPYPAVFFLWWCSWIPSRWRPRAIADAYLSIWDSLFVDRANGRTPGWFKRFVKAFESRALKYAERVIVDTEANREMFAVEFRLDRERILALPLAIDEAQLLATPPSPPVDERPLTVLFVGTFVPLQGIDVMMRAIGLLIPDPRLRFVVVGDGQMAPAVEQLCSRFDAARFHWQREWEDAERIAGRIAESDICLGVFGATTKSARVLPLKVYAYLAAGRATITRVPYSLPASTPCPPVVEVPAADAEALASAIRGLAAEPKRREQLGREARRFFLEHLGSSRLAREWSRLLATLDGPR